MMNREGKHLCDGCGWDVENGGVLMCAIVSDLDPYNEGRIRNLEFCRDHEDGGRLVKGCVHKLLRPSILKNYEGSRDAEATQSGE